MKIRAVITGSGVLFLIVSGLEAYGFISGFDASVCCVNIDAYGYIICCILYFWWFFLKWIYHCIQITKDLSKLPARLQIVHWRSNAANLFDLVLANQTLKEMLPKWTKLTSRILVQTSYLDSSTPSPM